jgi:hypothetical protein
MGYGHYTDRVGTIYGRVVSSEHWRDRWGATYTVVEYWAQIVDDRDIQYPLINCPHNHREPENALPCLRRLMKLAVKLAEPKPVAPGRVQTLTLDPDQIRGALKIVLGLKKTPGVI